VGFVSAERFARGALGLAGAEGEPLRVWLEDWELLGAAGGRFPVRLRASDGDLELDLELRQGKAATLHGEQGFHLKDPLSGGASHYYSLTRLETSGRLRVGGQTHAAEGLSWMDREWSTGGLPPGVQGWDWMGLQLNDGLDLMLFRLRSGAGAAEPGRGAGRLGRGGAAEDRPSVGAGAEARTAQGGTLILRDGSSRTLSTSDLRLEVLERWRSPLDGATYPSRWRVTVPSAGLDLEVRPILDDQELNHAYRYWEGAVDVRRYGTSESLGWGFLEMTGYGGDLPR
jgi:predicted secreted hydrolase